MNSRVFLCAVLFALLSACEPKSPEKPNKPPIPNTAQTLTNLDASPTFTSQIETAGRRTRYSAYFDGAQLTDIKESSTDASNTAAEYHYRGARLLKYTQTVLAGQPTLLELDDQGHVQRALAGTRELAPAEIDSIRTRAQLLRSHALAQRASKLHVQ